MVAALDHRLATLIQTRETGRRIEIALKVPKSVLLGGKETCLCGPGGKLEDRLARLEVQIATGTRALGRRISRTRTRPAMLIVWAGGRDPQPPARCATSVGGPDTRGRPPARCRKATSAQALAQPRLGRICTSARRSALPTVEALTPNPWPIAASESPSR
jgi:hypothetical protein